MPTLLSPRQKDAVPEKCAKKCHILSFSPLLSGGHFGKLTVYFSSAKKRNGQIQRDQTRMG
jgi:hypothetical protein